MGADTEISLHRRGFFPAEGGEVRAMIRPSAPQPVELPARGDLRNMRVHALVAGVPRDVAEREPKCVTDAFAQAAVEITLLHQSVGPGNVVSLTLEFRHVTELFCSFGERGRTAERVADRVVPQACAYGKRGARR